ncbi:MULTISPECIES: DUF1453 family protein [unclassified Streptomyces]|uniref:DUF1453 family protein n=1 Tax=unclassified Streptomyces TaxID=2593676 RepID=UPI000DAEF760|nr:MULTISPECIES: DUF1453 family protein [unclassified Streptomyces]PZT77125.1 DUF1453 domain-containing protein [Streptomyces sp. AC1-42W]PZT78923.1 DUF1453 domain-containing protein [Streptomyces sp. AC1-42T]
MSGLGNALVIIAVIALVVVRQFSAERVSGDHRWWVPPAVLLFLALRKPELVDPDHRIASAVILGAELLVGLATGAGWAWTTRVWRAEDGSVWSKGTRATVLVWIAGLGLRAALYGIAVVLDVHQGSPALMAALAVTLLVRAGLLTRRAAAIPAPSRGPAGVALRPEWKDPV